MKSKVIVICMFLLILCSLSIVSAQDTTNETQITQYANDTVLTDSSTDLLTDSSRGSFDDLQNEINNADSGSVLYLQRDYKASDGANIKLDKSLTIDGQGHTLDCGVENKNVKAFTSEKGDITLKNLNIFHGHDDKKGTGGAIFITGTAKYTIINCTFIDNWADDYGGAIYNNVESNALTIIDSTFKENEADDDHGGAIYSKGEVEIYNSIFEKNHANIDGGAVYAEKLISVYDSTFSNNKAEPEGNHVSYGGAICAKEEIYASNCGFDNNYADDDGGAIYAYNSAFINKCTFTENTAYDAGGAIYKSGSEYLSIDDSTFTGNKAKTDEGGAVYCAGKAIVSDSTFTSNSADEQGGAIYTNYIQFAGDVYFIKNTANDHGGAVYAVEVSGYIENLYFESNTADDGDGGAFFIYRSKNRITFFNCTFIKNCAKKGDGGAILTNEYYSDTLFVTDCIFSENYADGGATDRWGGAIYCFGSLYISNSTFFKNWSEDYAGAVFVKRELNIDGNSKFIGNYVKDNDGGAIWCNELKLVENSLFYGNKADDDGGAIYIDDACKTKIVNSYFEDNSAGARGGAIYSDSVLSSNKLTLTNNAFVHNDVGSQGKDVFHCGKYESISGNWWGDNSPSFSGDKTHLIEYHTFESNEKHKDESYNTVKASIDADEGYVDVEYNVKITFAKEISPYVLDKIQLSSNLEGTFSDISINGNSFDVTYTPKVLGNHKITIKVNNQPLTLDLPVRYTSVYGYDLVKVQGDSKTFSAFFKDDKNSYLPSGTEVVFAVGADTYTHTVSDNGIATCDEVLTFSPGVYEIKSINMNTYEFFTSKLTVLSRNITYNLNDTFIINFANFNNASENESVTFKIAGKTFVSNITQGYAYFMLDVPAGKHTVEVMYKGLLVQRIDIQVLNQYSKAVLDVDGNNYAAFLPISNEETFNQVGTVVYSEIGNNMRRYVFPSGTGLIVYNVTVSNSDQFNNVLEEIAKDNFYADVIIINLKRNVYKLNKGSYRDQEWNYNIHLTHGSLYINGDDSIIDDGYNNNFITIESGCDVTIQDLTFTKFYRVFVNNGDLLCKNCYFTNNEAYFISTSTPGSVIYNKNRATFEYCTLNSNQNYLYKTADVYEYDLQGAVYADANSLTQFVQCVFKDKEKDSLRAVDGSMVILYDDNDTNYKLFTTGFTSTLELGSCLDFRPVSSYKSNKSDYMQYSDTIFDLAEMLNSAFHYSACSDFMITLNSPETNQEITVDDFEKIASPNDYRTYNREHSFMAQAGPKDNFWSQHRFLFEIGSRPIVIDGKGVNVVLKDNDENDDNHFAFVPNYGSLTLMNMVIKGFNTAIVNYGELILINCTLEDNKIHYNFQSMDTEYGGAVRSYSEAYFYNCTFKNNGAYQGGAYYGKGNGAFGQFYNCTFKGNEIISNLKWDDGDSNNMYVDGSVVKLINCKGIHEGNIKKENGGVVVYRDNLKESILNVYVDSPSDLFRLSSLVKYNTKYDVINATFAKGDYSVMPDSHILLEMDYGVLILSGNGARVYVNSPDDDDETQFLVTTSHSSVVMSGLTIEGFNIAINNAGGLNIFNSTLKNNKVDYAIKKDYGGAIVNNHGGYITIFNSTFTGNYAKYGGAIYNSGTLKVFISKFSDNVAYDGVDENIDIYNNQTAVTVFAIKDYPTVENKFPMAAWKEDLIYVGITLGITAITAGISWGVSATGIAAAHAINVFVGAGVGAIGGSVRGLIYSIDHHDYSTFGDKLIDGINTGIRAVTFGENLRALHTNGYIFHNPTPQQIQMAAYNRFLTKYLNKFIVDIVEIIDNEHRVVWRSLLK